MSTSYQAMTGACRSVRRDVAGALLAWVLIALFIPCGPAAVAQTKPATWRDCDPGGIQTLSVPDPVSGRSYDVEISLPADYDTDTAKRHPVLYLADGGRAIRPLTCLVKALYGKGELMEEPIIVGLSYARGETLEVSRKRDYTPVPLKPGDTAYGGGQAYQLYLRATVIPHVESLYRVDPGQRLYWGHSYGGLLGTRILLTEPDLFKTYILGSPSLWFADHAILVLEADYAKANSDLKADVLMYVGGEEVSRYDPSRRGHTRDMVGDMKAFEAQLKQRSFPSLTIRSLVVPGKNHRNTIPSGFTWAITSVLGGSKTVQSR
ncbi:alpha/beta hydrolase [Labrys sp. 22185]|uniref:alpha/beta hydrolase n=1 Tax=Labrys sp. 22185 TaxID=3453888 RepID=UPI003F8487EB